MSIIKIVDASTGEEIERDMTPEELKAAKNADAEWQNLQKENLSQAATKEAILKRLGLTADEVATLLA